MKANKILLIRPPYHFESENKYDLPLGLLYIAAVLEKEGYSINLLVRKPREILGTSAVIFNGYKICGDNHTVHFSISQCPANNGHNKI